MTTAAILTMISSAIAYCVQQAEAEARDVLSGLLDDGKITADELEDGVRRIADAALPLELISPLLEDLSDDLIDDLIDMIVDLLTRDADELEGAAERKLDRAVELELKADALEAAGHPKRAARALKRSARKMARAAILEIRAAEKREDEDDEG